MPRTGDFVAIILNHDIEGIDGAAADQFKGRVGLARRLVEVFIHSLVTCIGKRGAILAMPPLLIQWQASYCGARPCSTTS